MSYISLGFSGLVVFDRLGTWTLPVITMYFYVFEQFRSPRSFGALQALEFDCIYLDFNWITSLHLLGTVHLIPTRTRGICHGFNSKVTNTRGKTPLPTKTE